MTYQLLPKFGAQRPCFLCYHLPIFIFKDMLINRTIQNKHL